MQVPSEISFHNLEHSDAIESSIERWIARLDTYSDRITRCDVTLGQPHKSNRHGSTLEVTIKVGLPGAEPIISHTAHDDPYVAIADAFRAARRQLIDRTNMRREFVEARGRYTLAT